MNASVRVRVRVRVSVSVRVSVRFRVLPPRMLCHLASSAHSGLVCVTLRVRVSVSVGVSGGECEYKWINRYTWWPAGRLVG